MFNIKEAPELFYIGEDPKHPDGQLQYSYEDKVLVIWHTEVGDSLKGQGAASALVAYAVDYARRQGIKITPFCPYALAQFQKHPEYADVWFKD